MQFFQRNLLLFGTFPALAYHHNIEKATAIPIRPYTMNKIVYRKTVRFLHKKTPNQIDPMVFKTILGQYLFEVFIFSFFSFSVLKDLFFQFS